MTAEQYRLSMAAKWLNTIRKRDYAIAQARELFELGHRLTVVRALILEARLHNHMALRQKRAAQ